MKKSRRILAAFMLLCMVIPMISPILPVSATGAVCYEPDTAGSTVGIEPPNSEVPPGTEDYAERNQKLAQDLFHNVRTRLPSK